MSQRPQTTPIERRPHDPEAAHALQLANKVLDQPGRDPDDDLSVLARRMLREREIAGVWLKATADARADRDRLTAVLHSILTTSRKSAHPECITIAREAWVALGLPPEASP